VEQPLQRVYVDPCKEHLLESYHEAYIVYTGVGQKNWNTWFYYTIIC